MPYLGLPDIFSHTILSSDHSGGRFYGGTESIFIIFGVVVATLAVIAMAVLLVFRQSRKSRVHQQQQEGSNIVVAILVR